MGKKRQRPDGGDVPGRDAKSVRRAIRKLGLPDSRQSPETWYAQASATLPETDIANVFKSGGAEASDYDEAYKSFDHARILSAGWRSHMLELECIWMLPILRRAIQERRAQEPVTFLVELGAGSGAASAILGSILNIDVIAVDTHDLSAPRIQEMAAITGASVEAHQADVTDLSKLLAGRTPAAIFEMSTVRYLQVHQHMDGGFSNRYRIERNIKTTKASDAFAALLKAANGGDILLSEMSCIDYVGEIEGAAATFGYHLDPDDLTYITGQIPTEEVATIAMHLRRCEEVAEPAKLLAALSGPVPSPRTGLHLEGAAAESLRLALGELSNWQGVEITYNDGSGTLRRETGSTDSHFVVYQSTTRSFQSIDLYAVAEGTRLTQEIAQADVEIQDLATVKRIKESAALW